MSTSPSPEPRYDRVVVAGGSVAGLLAAAALAPLAREVVVLERDDLATPAHPRPGTPQAAHSHGLLASGRLAVEKLLPGFTDELLAGGAISRGDIGANGRWWIGGGLVTDTEVGADGVATSRRLVEETVRRRVRALPRVVLRDRCEVQSLLAGDEHTRVVGVRVLSRPSEGTATTTGLAADLVVDATGRSARSVRWLADQGWPQPEAERVRVGVRYATTHVERRPGDLDGRYVSVSAAVPPVPRVGVAIAQEDGTWTVSVCGYGEEQPPVDADGFRRFAAGVVSPDLARLLADRDLLHPPATYRFPDCRRRRFERVRLPLGLAAVGDAVASFDPTFGQGMSVAALQAVRLARHATRGLDAVRRHYPADAAEAADRAWTIAVGADLALPGTEGERPRGHRLVSRYVARAQRVAHHDPAVARTLMRVTNLLDPPSALMAPATAYRVLLHGRARSRSRSGSTTVVGASRS
ncbi:NAD(P)/FAD-dependent oxidoreductase [Nocardioides sp. GXQ0305]|uniref:NAD(P)/FAD-dependent oxidoreductase n=1 Tax=Nocardioides sp. GXQ0305 TaxID=3423912 RepID=UPI003D7C457D